MASNEETNAAGTDTRPPILLRKWTTNSWKIRIHMSPRRHLQQPQSNKHCKRSCRDNEVRCSCKDQAHTTSAPALLSPSNLVLKPTAQVSPNGRFDGHYDSGFANLFKCFPKQFPPPTTSSDLPPTQGPHARYSRKEGDIVTTARGEVRCGYAVYRTQEKRWTLNTSKIKLYWGKLKREGDLLMLKLKHSPDNGMHCTYVQPKALTTTNMFQANHEMHMDSERG
ncbi:hypothetical protein Tco_0218277 [Tanacetum coccineum]